MTQIVGASDDYWAHWRVPAEEIATIGDEPNDVLMFERSGPSIAVGNAFDQVKARASTVTDSYGDEGFAKVAPASELGASIFVDILGGHFIYPPAWPQGVASFPKEMIASCNSRFIRGIRRKVSLRFFTEA